MLFKGGTSLSKGWNLVARLSEDIDIALDPMAFGVAYQYDPSKTFVEKLKKSGCAFTTNVLKRKLEMQLTSLGITPGIVSVVAVDVPEKFPDTDPQTLFVKYKSLYEVNPYLNDEVKVEVSVRSIRIPYTRVALQSLLNKINPREVYKEVLYEVDIVEPRKTFLEKLFLLHEEFKKPDTAKIRSYRMSRHLSDIYKIARSSIAKEALVDYELFDRLLFHRERYSRLSWVNYSEMRNTHISFVPPDKVINLYENDYELMLEQMIYEEEPPSFDAIVEELKRLQSRIRSGR